MTNDPQTRPTPVASMPAILAVAAVLLASLVATGCGDGEQQQQEVPEYDFPIEVEATDTENGPVDGVPVFVDEQLVGFTDADGTFEASLREKPTESLKVGVEAPDGYRMLSEETSVEETLQITESLEGDYQGVPVSLRVDLESLLVEHLVWLELTCDDDLDDQYCRNVPIELGGEPVAHTDRDGRTHFTFESTPGETRRLSIPVQPSPPEPEEGEEQQDVDDEDLPEIEPDDPVYEFETTREATVYQISEEFTDADADDTDYTPPTTPSPPTTTSSSSDPDDSSPSDGTDASGEEDEEPDNDIIKLFDEEEE